MKAVIQRVENAHVSIHNKIKSKINSGYVILLGIHKNDTFQDSEWIIKKDSKGTFSFLFYVV